MSRAEADGDAADRPGEQAQGDQSPLAIDEITDGASDRCAAAARERDDARDEEGTRTNTRIVTQRHGPKLSPDFVAGHRRGAESAAAGSPAPPGIADFQRRGAAMTLGFAPVNGPVKDIAATATLILAFATWVTVHVALAARLLLRSQPRWRGLVALVVPPLAPMYGFRQGWRRMSTLWLVWPIVYVLALLIARV